MSTEYCRNELERPSSIPDGSAGASGLPVIIEPMLQWNHSGGEREIPMARELLRDRDSLAAYPSMDVLRPVFGAENQEHANDSSLRTLVDMLDRWNIRWAQVSLPSRLGQEAVAQLDAERNRIFVSIKMDPHRGMAGLRELDDLIASGVAVKSVSVIPAMLYPPLAPDAKEFFPLYTRCVDLNIPIMINVGFPGPRVPSRVQDPVALDEVLWFFPDLKIVMKHGGDPWTRTCFKLLEKWPNSYFITTGMAPHRYPAEIMALLRSGTKKHKVLYGGYWPLISYPKILAGIAELGLSALEAQAFLYDNASALFGLGK